MSRALFAWELGGGYGHIATLLPLALALRERGHEVVFALKETRHAEALLGRERLRYVQAPVWLARFNTTRAPENYAEMLYRFGYLSAPGLAGMVSAWQGLVNLVQPDLLLADHAPTALLATRGANFPRAAIGNGFLCPPCETPMPPMRTGGETTRAHLLASEQKVLDTANRVLAARGQPSLATLASLFELDETFLCTFPELDHYPERRDAVYRGARTSLDIGAAPSWPAGDGKKIFAYLKPEHDAFEPTLRILARTPHRTVLHAPGLSGTDQRRLETANLKICLEPLALGAAAAGSDVAICHAGVGTVSVMLLHARPLLLLPMQQEQSMLAARVVALGAGLSVPARAGASRIAKLLARVLYDETLAGAAGAFATRHADFDHAAETARIVERCEILMASRPGTQRPAMPGTC